MNTINKLGDEIISQGFHIIDNFLEETNYQHLRAKAESMHLKGQFRQAKIGKNLETKLNETIRRDLICWLDEEEDEAVCAYFSKIRKIARTLNESLFLGLVDFETHFAVYQAGSFYKKHVDQFKTSKTRQISCVYYLNESWKEAHGGQLKLYSKKDELLAAVLPEPNRFICFTSDLPHEVCETKRTRYSLAGWMKTKAFSF